jgi:dTDP-4-amino-4,6-dideoxygalactose transaminase
LAQEKSLTNAHIFYLVTRNEREQASLIRHLDSNGISAVFHYVPLHNSPAGMQLARTSGPLPVTENISARLVRLPMYSELNTMQVAHICKIIANYFKQ